MKNKHNEDKKGDRCIFLLASVFVATLIVWFNGYTFGQNSVDVSVKVDCSTFSVQYITNQTDIVVDCRNNK